MILKRDKDLYEHKALSLEELQGAQLDVVSAEATLEDDEAHVKIAGTGKGEAFLRAPITGVVVARHVSVGEAVQSGGNTVFTITDPTLVWVIAHVYPEDVRRVSIGDAAQVHSAALEEPMNGKVTYIGASIDTDTLTVPIRVAVANAKGTLKAGLYVDAAIAPARSEEVQLLPLAALCATATTCPWSTSRLRRASSRAATSRSATRSATDHRPRRPQGGRAGARVRRALHPVRRRPRALR